MTDRAEKNWRWVAEIVIVLLMTIQLSFSGWLGTQVVNNGKELSKINANNLTNQDGLEIYKEIAAVKERVAAFLADGFSDRFNKLELKIDALSSRIARLEN